MEKIEPDGPVYYMNLTTRTHLTWRAENINGLQMDENKKICPVDVEKPKKEIINGPWKGMAS
jgi:hypothetical protein